MPVAKKHYNDDSNYTYYIQNCPGSGNPWKMKTRVGDTLKKDPSKFASGPSIDRSASTLSLVKAIMFTSVNVFCSAIYQSMII